MVRPKGGASRRRNAAALPLPPRSGKPDQVVASGVPPADLFKGFLPSRSQLHAAPSHCGRPALQSRTLGRGSCQAHFYPQILLKTPQKKVPFPGNKVQPGQWHHRDRFRAEEQLVIRLLPPAGPESGSGKTRRPKPYFGSLAMRLGLSDISQVLPGSRPDQEHNGFTTLAPTHKRPIHHGGLRWSFCCGRLTPVGARAA